MIRLTDLQSSRSVIDDLADAFDFNIDRASRDYSWIKLDPEHRFLVIAGESTGGAFLAYGNGDFDQVPILYVTSEGGAGKLASNLGELLAIVLALPYWEELLKFSAGGDLAEMRKTAELARENHEQDEIVTIARIRLIKALDIPEISDPIGLLHHNVNTTDCTVVAEDGWRYESLFNTLTSHDMKRWC